MVDLFRVPGEDDLAALADSGKDGLDHMGAEILTFIANNELARDAAAPDIGLCTQFDLPLSRYSVEPLGRICSLQRYSRLS